MNHLEIYLSPIDAQHFNAIATHSPVGDGFAEAKLPFWQGNYDRLRTLIKVLELSSGYTSKAFPDAGEQAWMEEAKLLSSNHKEFRPDYLETIGNALYQALFPVKSSLRACLESALRLSEQTGDSLHIRLKFSTDSVKRSYLANYPWELIHDGQRFLLQSTVLMSRYLAYEEQAPKLPKIKHVKVLLITSSAADKQLGMCDLPNSEQIAIQKGLSQAQGSGTATLERLARPTLKGLSVYLSECAETPHIIHFDGHGLYGRRCNNPNCLKIHPGVKKVRCSKCNQLLPLPNGFLVFENDERDGCDYVSATDFGRQLPKEIILVVVSACQSSMAMASNSLFSGVAQQLIDARVPAVVAMQYTVRVDAACQFTEHFYRLLGQRAPLAEAVKAGRSWMRPVINQWYRPVLYLRWQDNEGGQIFTAGKADLSNTRLSQFDRLQRDRWKEELKDWEQHYAAVQDQLRIETNPVTRNRLERQIIQIGTEINSCEQRLIQMEKQGE